MSRQICPLVDSNGIYWYLRKVRKNSASCVFLRWLGREVSVRQVGFGSFLGQVKLTGQTCFRNRSLLAGAGNTRIGARAFPTLEGLCGPEAGYGAGSASGFVLVRTTGKPSRFSSEIGTKTDAKQ